MLESTKQDYEQTISLVIPNWRKLDKNDLCNLYIEHEDDPIYTNACFAGLMLKCWPTMLTYYNKCYISGVSIMDIHDIVVDAIMYALENRKWLDPTSNLYNDPDGPDKAINIKLKFLYYNISVAFTRDKRSAETQLLSMDALEEENGVTTKLSPVVYPEDEYNLDEAYLKEYIRDAFKKKDYILAFIVDLVMTNPELVVDKQFQCDKLCNKLINMSDEYLKQISYCYDIPLKEVKRASTYICKQTKQTLAEETQYAFEYLRMYYNTERGFTHVT